RPALQELTVINAPGRRERVLQLPREPDTRVVVRVSRPAQVGAAGHRLPEAGHALREAVERRAKADLTDEREGGALAPHPTGRPAAEPPVANALERLRRHEVDC